MIKKGFLISTLILTVILAVSCGVFSADPKIDSMIADKTSIKAGDSVVFTVKGSTKNADGSSDLADYSGVLTISSTPAGITEKVNISANNASGFEKKITITFADAGTYKLSATLTAGEKSAESTAVTITVAPKSPWSNAAAGQPFQLAWGYSKQKELVSAGEKIWFKFTTSRKTSFKLYYEDKSTMDPVVDYFAPAIFVTVYNSAGNIIAGPDSGNGELTIPALSFSGPNTDIYLKVEGKPSTSTGHFKVRLYE